MTAPIRPAALAELERNLAGQTPAVVMASGDDMRALLAYVRALEGMIRLAPLSPEPFGDVERRAREAGL